jgi:RHS repeat-associated protein
VTVTDALSHANSYGYDAMSNLTTVTDALSRVTNYDYDDFNRLKKITYPPATTGATRLFEAIAYDGDGNATSRTDTAGRVTSYVYDSSNRLTGTTDAANGITSFQYDALSRLTLLTDAINQQYQFGYDALGRQTSMTRAGVSMTYTYDAVGNRTQRIDYNGATTNYAYDDLNRLITISYPDTSSATYTYDALSRLASGANQNGAVSFAYDNRGRVSSTTDVWGQTVGYSYDANGNRTAMTLNGSGYATYAYDVVNRLTSLADSANLNFTYSYDAANRLTSRTAPNGVTSAYAYDGLDRLTALTHVSGANTLIANQYTYNEANNIVSWTNGSGNHIYTYDAVDRLTSATSNAIPNESYSYDAVGNRTASHLSASYGYQPFNKLTSTATATYSYDNNGNLISKTDASGTTTFNFNEENRLTQITQPTGLTVNYKYDGLDRRIQRTTSNGTNERYIYDNADVLIDLNADWSVATTYLNEIGVDSHLRQTNSATGVSYVLSDHLGSTLALTDAAGNAVEQTTYDSFGSSAGSASTRYGFTGRERDADTGLLYYRARFYDPQIGRFTSEDPIEFEAGDVNWYAYVMNNSINNTDEAGLQGRAGPKGKGNYHPPFRVRCNPNQDCATLARNMAEIARAIASAYLLDQELGFPRHQPPYSTDIPDWQNAFARCKQIYDKKCKDCGPPNSPVPVPNPARSRRPTGPTMDELRLQTEAARQMEIFWGKVLAGSVIGGAVVVAGPPAAGWILRLAAGGGGAWVFQH